MSLFPPSMYADCTANLQRTTNCYESFQSKFNCFFDSPHTNIVCLADTLLAIQSKTYIKIHSAPSTRSETAKMKHTNYQIAQFGSKIISRFEYSVAYVINLFLNSSSRLFRHSCSYFLTPSTVLVLSSKQSSVRMK